MTDLLKLGTLLAGGVVCRYTQTAYRVSLPTGPTGEQQVVLVPFAAVEAIRRPEEDTDPITIDRCPEASDDRHRLDPRYRCDLCDIQFTADEVWEGP